MKKVMARPIEPPPLPPKPKVDKAKTKQNKPRKLWDNYIEIASIQKSERLRLVVSAGAHDGYRCINIREFYYVKRDGVWKPGRDGILIPLNAPLNRTRVPDPNNPPKIIEPFKELLSVLQEAMTIASEMALADEANEVWLTPKEKEKKTVNENS